LDVGLSGLASRVRGRLRRFSEKLAARVASGMSLEQALEAESGAMPGEYRVLLAAGMRSGRFDAALGSMAEYAANLRDLRTNLRRALIYPGVVSVLAYSLLVTLFVVLVPELLSNVRSLDLPRHSWYATLDTLSRTALYWGPGIPGVLLFLWIVSAVARWMLASEGTESTTTRSYLGVWRFIPGVGGALRAAHWSRFAHLLAVLVDAGVPIVEAARLCAAAVGDGAVAAEIDRASRHLASGASLEGAFETGSRVPPMLRWLMTRGERESLLSPALREAAAHYAQRATLRAELVQKLVPMAVVVLVGGGITTVYALTVFVPLTSMWRGLAIGS